MRMALHPRVWVVWGTATMLMALQALRHVGGAEGQLGDIAILQEVATPFWLLLPVLVAATLGTSGAEDRVSRYERLTSWRGHSRRKIFWTNNLAAFVLAVPLAVTPLLAAAAILEAKAPDVGTEPATSALSGWAATTQLLPWLLGSVVLASLVTIIAANGLGALTGSQFTSIIGVGAGTFLVNVGLPLEYEALKPQTYLSLSAPIPVSAGMYAAYWLGLLGLMVIAVSVAFRVERR
jgi:uncharacterized membrane protein YhaH (DUF805 family)